LIGSYVALSTKTLAISALDSKPVGGRADYDTG
jgi:hypothetical protein